VAKPGFGGRGGHRGSGGRKSPSGVQGQSPWWGLGGRSPPNAHSILRIFGCQTVHNFVYLAKLLESLVKHEKNLNCSACLFAISKSGRVTIQKL